LTCQEGVFPQPYTQFLWISEQALTSRQARRARPVAGTPVLFCATSISMRLHLDTGQMYS
jgi:hypothetical protein